MPEKASTMLTFNLTYMMVQRKEIVFIKLTSCPQLGENIKWSFLGDPQCYSFAKFREMLSQTPYRRGVPLKFYIVDEAAGRLEGIGIDISKDWPLDLAEDKIIARQGLIDISEQLGKLDLL